MQLSKKTKQRLYQAIDEPILDARIHLLKAGGSADVDFAVAQITEKIWSRVQKALNFKEQS